MRLSELIGGAHAEEVTGFAIDHRKVAPGTVFGAFQGSAVNGEDFIAPAVEAGAVAVVARPQAPVARVPHVADANPRRRFAELAARFFAPFPDICIAVTGTNGKTSTVELTRQLWTLAGHRAASVGTLGVTVGEDRQKTGLTTPDIVTFLGTMGGLRREGVSHAAFEASSHGLDQYRSWGVPVRVAAFTNLSRDHLDYHGTMEAYLAAKLKLFRELVADGGTAVVWADDPASAQVIAAAEARGLAVRTVGTRGELIRLVERTPTALGQELVVEADGRRHPIHLPLIGAYQSANALVAAGLVIATGGEPATTIAHLARLVPVRGRLERAVITRSGAPVYVDYAHTPDALTAACAALRPHTARRLLLVFGAGGDRDQGKRAPMGAAAIAAADLVIVTDDNPRTEDPADIRRSILAAAPGAVEVADRREAIGYAIAQAGAADVVLVAGKGHEEGQVIRDQVLPFSDVAVAREMAA